MMKKIISLVLVVCFLFSCFVVSTSAEVSNIIPETEEDLILSQNTSESAYDTIKNVSETLDNTKYFHVAPNYKTHYTKGDALSFRLNLNSFSEYDRSKTFFSSTENIMLNDYAPKEYSQSEDLKNLNVSFDINPVIISKAPLLNFKEVSFEKIYATTKVYAGEKIVDSEFTQLSILPTVYGVFVSEFGDIYAYDQYISYLYSNDLITDAEYKLAAKKATELTEVEETKPTIGAINQPKLRVYNEKTNSIELQADYTLQEISIISDEDISLLSTDEDRVVFTPSLSVARTIEALDSGARLRVYGEVFWNDIDGYWHPARNIEVKIMDENLISDTTLATIYTNHNGYYSATFNNKTGIFENGLDIYIRVNTINEDFEIVTDVANSLFTDGYYFTTGVANNVTTSQVQANYAAYDMDVARSASIHQALIVGYYYFKAMNGSDTNTTVFYPVSNQDTSSAIIEDAYIRIINDDYCSWDAIIHELGHHAASKINIYSSFGQEHRARENLCERYGKEQGIRGAWNEGWASYFSMAAQLYYNSTMATISSIPYVADNIYTIFDIENNTIDQPWHTNYTTQVGITEGCELTVTAVLLYLNIDSGINRSFQEVWNIVKQSQAKNFSDFIQTLYSWMGKEYHSKISEHLEKHHVADRPIARTTLFSRTQPGTFYWSAALVTDVFSDNNHYVYYNQSRIAFYDKNMNFIVQSPFISSSLGNYGTTINADQWNYLANHVGAGDFFYWRLITYSNSAPVTGPYYSTLRQGSFQDDTNLNSTFSNTEPIDALVANDVGVDECIVPESEEYVHYFEGSDSYVKLPTKKVYNCLNGFKYAAKENNSILEYKRGEYM